MISRFGSAILICVLLLVAECGTPCPAFAKQQETKVISADDRGLTLEVVLPPFSIVDEQGPDDVYQRIRMQGWARVADSGSPEIPLGGVLIQVPPSGEIKVEVLEASFETLPNILLYPVPRRVASEGGKIRSEFYKNSAAYQSPEFFPGKQAEVSSQGIMRGVPLARVLIYPFQWNASSRELRYSSRIRLRIQFEHPMSLPSTADALSANSIQKPDAFQQLMGEVIVNYQHPRQVMPQTVGPGKTRQSSSPSLRIEIKKEGIYQLTYSDLANAGVPLSTFDPKTFQMFNMGIEVPIKVSSKGSNRFVAGDILQFYGQSIDSTFTDTNVYMLKWGKRAGKRIPAIGGKISGNGTKVSAFFEHLHVEENHIMWEATPGAPGHDYWFWEKLTASAGNPAARTYPIDIPSPAPGRTGAVLSVGFQGRSDGSPHPNHHTQLQLNGIDLGNSFWDGTKAYVQKATVGKDLLRAGGNTLSALLPCDTGGSIDIVFLNWIDVGYWRLFEAIQDSLKFTVEGNGRLQMEISNLSDSKVLIFDVTNPQSVMQVSSPSIVKDQNLFKASFEVQVKGMKSYLVLTASQVKKPDGLQLLKPTDLKDSQTGANFILITPREFLPSVSALVKLHQDQKLKVKAVAIEDIYNEFSHGLFDPAAIKSFLRYAYTSWKRPAPSFVLLVGDANTDYRDYFNTGKKNRVPVHLSVTGLGLTPDDNWYVSVQGEDALPEMMIGRISGSSTEAVAKVIDKIIRFVAYTDYAPHDVLLVSDNDDSAFEAANESLIHYLPSGFNADKVYLSTYDSTAEATADIVSNIDRGMMMTNYVGHGGVTVWAGESLFQSSDVRSLNNGDRLTFVITLDCLNGYFSQPYYYSLAEEFVIAPDKGAIAGFAPSGFGYLWEHEILSSELFSLVFERKKRVLGMITTQAKIAAFSKGTSPEVLKEFTLLGDPAVQLKAW